MNRWLLIFLFLSIGQALAGEPKYYAELHRGSSAEVQLVIYHDVWVGLFTVHGFGGYRRNNDYKASLKGEGPIFYDPEFYTYDTPLIHRGTITVDRKVGRVVINLVRIVSKPGEPEKWETSPANGTYPIKAIDKGL